MILENWKYSYQLALIAGAICCVCLGCTSEVPTSSNGGAKSDGQQLETLHGHIDQPAQRKVVSSEPATTISPDHENSAHVDNQNDVGSDLTEFVPIFVDWPKPDLTLFLTGRQNGFIEPCGCSGLDSAKGGLSRRHTLLQQLRAKDWNVISLDLGNQVRRFGRQAELKFQTTVDSLKAMSYQAVTFGPRDLRLPFGELYAAVAGLDGEPGPFVCANAQLFDIPARFRLFDTRYGKVGVTAVLGQEQLKQIGAVDEIESMSAESALNEVVVANELMSCDFRLLLAHASSDESRMLARKFPQFDLIVTAGGADEPALELHDIEGTAAKLAEVGAKGMYVTVVGLYKDSKTPIRYERVPLDARFSDSEAMLDIFASYQKTLEQLGLEGLGLKPVKHPSRRTFVGSSVCGDCHSSAYEIHQSTPHYHATDSIAHPTERSHIVRHFDPECLSCHVTGWSPQGYFPYQSGYVALEESELLHGNGCENCHGPGSAHVAAESGETTVTDEELQQLRADMRLTLEEARKTKCYECHDLDNSPDFQKEGAFEEYWEQVKHYGKE